MKRNIKKIISITTLTFFGVSTMAFAGSGDSRNNMGGGHHGLSHGGTTMNGCGGDYAGNLTPEQLTQLNQDRAEFFKETESLRQNLHNSDQELRRELAKENPDTEITSKLQSEVSKFQSELYQKSLEHETKMRKAIPDYNGGYTGHGNIMNGQI